MGKIWTMGELLVEVMRPEENMEFHEPLTFKGPYASGSSGIFIRTAARMGAEAGIISGVGRDGFGKCVLDHLKADGVDVRYVLESEHGSTGVAFVMYYSDGERKFIFHWDHTPAVEAKMPDVSKMGDVSFFHMMGCALTSSKDYAKEIVKTMHAMKEKGAKISFDPNIRMEHMKEAEDYDIIQEVVKATNVFLPGKSELRLLTGEEDIEKAVKKCFDYPDMEIVVLKNGSKGSTIYTRDAQFEMGAYPVEALDATGAGDSFDGAFIASLALGRSLEDAAKAGAAAGALNAAAFGPMEGDISPETVAAMIEKNS